MKNTYYPPQIKGMAFEMDSQILTGSQVTVDFVDDSQEGTYDGAFHSSENIFIWDDEEEEQ